MSLSVEAFKKQAALRIVVMLVLGLITLVLAPFTGHYRGYYLCLTLGGIIFVTSVIYLALIYASKRELRDVAIKSMQCLWISTSMGIGYMVTALAPYFNIVMPINIVLFVIGLVLTVFGAYVLLAFSKRTGIPLAV